MIKEHTPKARELYLGDGQVIKRPRVLPQERWLVSDAPDELDWRVYKRAGWLVRLVTGKRWRLVSGRARFSSEERAWRWVEGHCVNRVLLPADWHGVGYARHMQAQSYREDWQIAPWLCHYTAEPSWVYQLYRDGPPDW